MDRVLIILLYFTLLLVMYMDINKKFIPNFINIFILILAIFYSALKEPLNFFIAISTYSLPLILIYGYVSDFLKKEVIGFGDIKLIISLSAFIYQPTVNLFLQIYIFYLITFVSASIYILFLFVYKFLKNKNWNLKNRELAFSPFIIISFTINFIFNLNSNYWEFFLWKKEHLV